MIIRIGGYDWAWRGLEIKARISWMLKELGFPGWSVKVPVAEPIHPKRRPRSIFGNASGR